VIDASGEAVEGAMAGKGWSGSESPNAKITEVIVRDIKLRALYGETPTEIARSLPISARSVGMIIDGKRWRNVDIRREDYDTWLKSLRGPSPSAVDLHQQ
jgi:hypothetical protein